MCHFVRAGVPESVWNDAAYSGSATELIINVQTSASRADGSKRIRIPIYGGLLASQSVFKVNILILLPHSFHDHHKHHHKWCADHH